MTEKFIEGRITGRRDFSDSLFALQFAADIEPFVAGQYCRLGLPLTGVADDPGAMAATLTMRPYSLVNAPEERPYEVIITLVPASAGGVLTPALHRLQPGDAVCVGPRAHGFFSLPEVPAAPVLWALATGTGNGAFLAMLKTARAWEQFERVVLVHAVRHANELTYREQVAELATRYGTRLHYVPVVSREAVADALTGRIPALIATGELERRAGITLSAETAHCMLCGNPQMVADTLAVLESKGLRKHRRRTPGQITTEAYW
ncbi:MAG: ferredoxin--NADP reductase [Burkholderiales bacterium]|nr:ferredoxin--NADP reductase [Burkholderiales bacterium]